ncbi:Rieske (2Fe-2S) protein [Candidatus Omnitrophota bacterium]
MRKKITRREFLKTGAKTALATLAITACGDLIAFGSSTKQKIDEITVGEDNLIIGLKELEQREAVNFVYQGKKSILLYNAGEIKAFENICTHKGGPTKLTADELVCQWHGAIFDPLTGKRLKGPAPSGSKLIPVELSEQSGKIYVS